MIEQLTATIDDYKRFAEARRKECDRLDIIGQEMFDSKCSRSMESKVFSL